MAYDQETIGGSGDYWRIRSLLLGEDSGILSTRSMSLIV